MAQWSVSQAEQFCTAQRTITDVVFIVFLYDVQIDWAATIRKSWDFSEEGAHARLEAFLHDGETPREHCKYSISLGILISEASS